MLGKTKLEFRPKCHFMPFSTSKLFQPCMHGLGFWRCLLISVPKIPTESTDNNKVYYYYFLCTR